MAFHYHDSRMQCVVTLVTFQDETGKPYLILGRSDPRYKDWKGECLTGKKLDVKTWQFFGGHVETEFSQPRDRWSAEDPQLTGWPEPADPQWQDGKHPLYTRVARNAMKELAEEGGIGDTRFNETSALHGLLKHSKLIYMKCETGRNSEGKMQDTHYLRLDLGKLSAARIDALQQSVHPGDDMIHTIIIPADRIYRDARGALVISSADGVNRYKTDFSGFPEIAEWNERFDVEEANAGSDAARAIIAQRRACFQKMNQLRDLDGVNETSLYSQAFIGMWGVHKPRENNDTILKEYLQKEYGIAPPLMPRQPGKIPHTTLVEKSPANDITLP